MLKAFEINNFKSYRSAKLPLAPLTVMIGANASGKSNAIEALRLVSWLAQGQKLSSIQYSVNSGEQVVRGTVESLFHSGSEEFGFKCEISGRPSLTWTGGIKLRPDGLHISRESVLSPVESVPLYTVDQESAGRSNDVSVAYNNFARGGKKPKVICSDQMAIFTQLTAPATFSSNHKQSRRVIPESARRIESTLSAVMFLDSNPQLMRGYSFPADERLRGDGSNLSAVLFNLCGQPQQDIEVTDFSDLLDGVAAAPELLTLIQSLPEQNIQAITFIREPRGGVMVALKESFGEDNMKFDASLLSDGTLRVLSIGAALLSAKEGSMVVIEEIDNGVHPSRAHHLLASIQRIAKARDLRVLLTTHNPALLDALPDDSIPSVVFCCRSSEDGSSKLLRLSDRDDFAEVIAQDTLGGLLTQGILDRFAKFSTTKRARREAALSWLRGIRQR
jgi:hypothetical protein